MNQKKKRKNQMYKGIIFISFLFLINFQIYSQGRLTEDVSIKLYKYKDVPYLIFYAEVSNNSDNKFSELDKILYAFKKTSPDILSPFYISESLQEILSKRKNNFGIIAFRGNLNEEYKIFSNKDSNFIISPEKLETTDYVDNIEEVHALTLILATENYKDGDTLVKYYYNKFYADSKNLTLPKDNYLLYYLKGTLIVAKHICEFSNKSLSIQELKDVCDNFEESKKLGNNESVFLKRLSGYYIEIARNYLNIDLKDYSDIAHYYNLAESVSPINEKYENEDLYRYANALYFIAEEEWVNDKEVSFEKVEEKFFELIKRKYKICESYLKLGAIYYMKGYKEKNFEESEKYFNNVINEKCSDELMQKAKNNLEKINKLKNK